MFICFLGSITIFWACDTPTPYGDLIITILDDRGNLIENAEVTLYLSLEDYQQEINPFRETLLTDAEGSISIFNLTDSAYYINVEKEILNNWENAVDVQLIKTENGFNNARTFIISNTKTGILSNANGKAWEINTLTSLPNINIPACLLDNHFVFFKNQKYQQIEGSAMCNASDPDLVSQADWQFSLDGTDLMFGENLWAITTINRSEFRVLTLTHILFPQATDLDNVLIDVSFVPAL